MADDRVWLQCKMCNERTLLLKKLGGWSLWPDTLDFIEKAQDFFVKHEFHQLVIITENDEKQIFLDR